MSRIVLTRSARRDLDSIRAYVARDSALRADRLLDWIKSKFKKLADQPLFLGGEWKSGSGIRVYSANGYTIFYRPLPGGAQIRRVMAPGLDPDALDEI
jgi:plasmid stabilization system protein ParE